jgi:hypothetical protein
VKRVTDRPIMGLLGQKPVSDRAVWVDYQAGRMALVPSSRDEDAQGNDPSEVTSRKALAGLLSPRASVVPFRLAGDGKIIVEARVSKPRPPKFTPWLHWILDTGSSKTVLFREALEQAGRPDRGWSTIQGLDAPTLVGSAPASMARVPALELRGAKGQRGRPTPLRVREGDIALLDSELAGLLSRATGERIDGLIGYSTLKRFRTVIDYPRRVIWLDPVPDYRDERPFEYVHVGLQIERRDGAIEVVGVVGGSPAAAAGIGRGDRLLEIDGVPTDSLGVLEAARRLEGTAGSSVGLVIRRGSQERRVVLRRRRLL